MGFMTTDDSPVIWRGPMLHGVIQFFRVLGQPRLPHRRHAAGHGRRGVEPEPDGSGRMLIVVTTPQLVSLCPTAAARSDVLR